MYPEVSKELHWTAEQPSEVSPGPTQVLSALRRGHAVCGFVCLDSAVTEGPAG